MKWEKETLIIHNGKTLSEALNKILANADDIIDLEKALKFFVDVMEEYRMWLLHKEDVELKFRQGWGKYKIWTVKIGGKK